MQWHIKTQKHQAAIGKRGKNTTMDKFLVSKDSSVKIQVGQVKKSC